MEICASAEDNYVSELRNMVDMPIICHFFWQFFTTNGSGMYRNVVSITDLEQNYVYFDRFYYVDIG